MNSLHYHSEFTNLSESNHLLLLSPEGNFLWQKSLHFENHYYADNGILFINTSNGVDLYLETQKAHNQDLDSLRILSIDFSGNAILKSIYSHQNLDGDNWNHFDQFSISPDGYKIIDSPSLENGFRNNLIGISFLDNSSHVNYKFLNTENDSILTQWAVTEWINNEEFIYFTTRARPTNNYNPADLSIFIARININGEVLWSKSTDLSETYFYYDNLWYNSLVSLSIEGKKLYVPISGSFGTGSGFLTIDIETGNLLGRNFWYKQGMNDGYAQIYKRDNSVYLLNYNYLHTIKLSKLYPPFILLDNFDSPSSCIQLPSCVFELNDYPLVLLLEETPLLINHPNSAIESRCSLQIELIPGHHVLKEICPEIVQQPDAYFTVSSDTLCQRAKVPVVVQHDHAYFQYAWTLNGESIEPVSASNDTFFFDFMITGEAELSLTTSRLGCEDNYSSTFYLIPGAQIESIGDTLKCKDIPLWLTLEDQEGLTVQWENGSKTIQIDTAGTYAYTSVSLETGCIFRKSISVKENNPPRPKIDSLYAFCNDDLDRNILPGVNNSVNKMRWIYPDQGSLLQVFAQKTDTYLLEVSNKACTDTISVRAQVLSCEGICPVFVPEAFTPNDDGINDFFEVFIGCLKKVVSFTMEIFDRWGNMVFKSDDMNHQWDGKFENQLAPAGQYTYKLRMDLSSDEGIEEVLKEGAVGLIR